MRTAKNKKTNELNELKSKMYANISHEFRTPLTIIRGLTDELLDDNNDDKQNTQSLSIGRTFINIRTGFACICSCGKSLRNG